MPTIKARANAAGALLWNGAAVGSVAGDVVTLTAPDPIVPIPRPVYDVSRVGSQRTADGTVNTYRANLTGYELQNTLATFPAGGTLEIAYRPVGGDSHATETAVVSALELDLEPGYVQQIVPGSTRFRFGGSVYTHTAGALYRDPSPATGAGSVAGTLDTSAGLARLTAWTGGGSNAVTLDALTTALSGQPVDEVVFRTAMSPIKTGTLQIRWEDCAGNAYSKTPSGESEDSDALIQVDFQRGLVRMRFGRWQTVASLTADELAASWYSAEAVVDRGGVSYIWHPHPAMAETIVYNAVAQSYLPPDSDLLGLDAARLPPDGQALIYRPGMLVLIHHEDELALPSLAAGAIIDCGRIRLYRVVIEDSAGKRLDGDLYTLDAESGIVTLADPLDLTGFTGPWTLKHAIADLRRVRATDINGTLTLLQAISYDFPGDAAVSGVLYIGTLQARVSNLFAQSTWTGWSDERSGSAPLYQYNDIGYPIVVRNAGAYEDRYLIQFTDATNFRLIGEGQGIIAVGDINTDFEPISARTGERLLFVDYRGWGLGWSAGACLRFNVAAAVYPVDLIRAVQPSDPTGLVDQVEMLLVGNVDA